VSFPAAGCRRTTAGGFARNIRSSLPVRVLGKVFRGKFVHALRLAFRGKRLTFAGQIQHLSEVRNFSSFLRTLFRQDWVVYAKPAFGGPDRSFGISAATPIALRFPIIDWFLSTAMTSRFYGVITLTATNKRR
jgi:Putative transposase